MIWIYNHDRNKANKKNIVVCWTEKLTKTLNNVVIMIGCTDLNSFRTFSRADKLRSFSCLLRCDRGSNAVVLNTHIGNFQATWIFTFVKVYQIFNWKLFKSVQPIIMSKFLRVLVDFSVQQTRISHQVL